MTVVRLSPRSVVGIAVVIAAGVTYACSEAEKPTAVRDLSTLPQRSVAPTQGTSIRSSAILRSQFAAARMHAKPIAAMHHEAMRDLRANYAEWRAGSGGRIASACEIGVRVAVKYTDPARTPSAVALSETQRRRAIQTGIRTIKGCEGATSANMFSAASRPMMLRAGLPEIGPYLYLYNDLVLAVIGDWNGATDLAEEVSSAVENMPYQYPLYDDDINYLATMVEFVSSSYGDATELPYPDNPNDQYDLSSIFVSPMRWPSWLKKVAKVVTADITGFSVGYGASNEEDEEQRLWIAGAAGVAASGAMADKCLDNETPCKSGP